MSYIDPGARGLHRISYTTGPGIHISSGAAAPLAGGYLSRSNSPIVNIGKYVNSSRQLCLAAPKTHNCFENTARYS